MSSNIHEKLIQSGMFWLNSHCVDLNVPKICVFKTFNVLTCNFEIFHKIDYSISGGSGDLARSCDQSIMWLYGLEPLKISRHASLGGRRHCGNESIMALVGNMILQDHVINGFILPRDLARPHYQSFMWLYRGEGGGLFKTNYLAKFGGHRHSGIGNMMVLVYHMISQDRMIEGS